MITIIKNELKGAISLNTNLGLSIDTLKEYTIK